MTRRPLIVLFLASLLMWCVCNGMGPLWPVYLARLGGGPAFVGTFSALGMLVQTAGNVAAGGLADRLQRRKAAFLLACVVWIVLLWLMSRITDLVQITAANTTASFAVGMAFTLVSILAGLSAGEAERGKVFGTLSLTLGAGMLIGGIVAGPIADRWGFPILLLVSAGGMGLALLCGFFFRDVTVVSRIPDGPRNATSRRAPLGGSYILLWGSVLLMSLAWYGGALGRIVAMNQLGFAATAISIATAVGGVVSLPVPLVLGWLSDRIGRKRLILFCYLAALAGLLIVAWTQLLWSFWGASALLTVGFTAYPLACALVADIVPPESLGMGLSLISAGSTLGGLLGSIGMGLAIQHMGAQTAFLAAALMPLAAAILLVPIHERAVRQETALPVAP